MSEQSDETYWLDEWKECRSSIARFDAIIVDLRKYGFSLITGLLTANTYLLAKIEDLTVWEKVAVYVVLAVLIYALFTVDRCYEILLRGAVERANELEERHEIALSIIISDKSARAKVDTWGKQVYSLFVVAAAIPPLASILNPLPGDLPIDFRPALLIGVLTILFLWLILVYHEAKQAKIKPPRKKGSNI